MAVFEAYFDETLSIAAIATLPAKAEGRALHAFLVRSLQLLETSTAVVYAASAGAFFTVALDHTVPARWTDTPGSRRFLTTTATADAALDGFPGNTLWAIHRIAVSNAAGQPIWERDGFFSRLPAVVAADTLRLRASWSANVVAYDALVRIEYEIVDVDAVTFQRMLPPYD